MNKADIELLRLMQRLVNVLEDIESTPGANLAEDKIQASKLNLLFDFARTTYAILDILVYNLSGNYGSDKET